MAVLDADERRRYATIRVKSKGGTTEGKFPMPDKAHARAALGRLNQAKPPLTAAQKEEVRDRAERILHGSAGTEEGKKRKIGAMRRYSEKRAS